MEIDANKESLSSSSYSVVGTKRYGRHQKIYDGNDDEDVDNNASSSSVMNNVSSSPFIYKRSQRNHPILCYGNKRFRRERTMSNGREYWRCVQLRCRGRLIIYDDAIVKYKMHDNHCTYEEIVFNVDNGCA